MEHPPTGRIPRWMDDNDSLICLGCSKEFGVLLRRHHCRRCGGLFCDECSNEYVQIPVPLLISPPLFSFVDVDPSVPNRCCASCVLFIREFLERRQQRSQQQRLAALAEAASVEQRIPSRIHRAPSPVLPPPVAAAVNVSSTSSSIPGGGIVTASATVSPQTTGSGTSNTNNTSTPLPPTPSSSSSEVPVAVVQGPTPLDDPHFESNTRLAASGLRIVPCQEFLLLNQQQQQQRGMNGQLSSTPGESPPPPLVRYKLYLVNVPYEIPPARKFQVNLDGRVLTVVLPYEVRPGDRCLIQAPAPPVVLKRATAAPIAPCTKREGFVSCTRCSFDNSVALLACQMCGETISLTHEALSEQVLPETRVLEITERCYEGTEWYHKRYLHKVPLHVRPDDVFEVILDFRPFTVICPVEAMGGDNIIIIAPATNNNTDIATSDGPLGGSNNNSTSNNSDSASRVDSAASANISAGVSTSATDTSGGSDIAQAPSSSTSTTSSTTTRTPSSDPIFVSRPLSDTPISTVSDPSNGPNPSIDCGPVPSPSPVSHLVCRLCTFENTPDNLRSLTGDSTSARASDEPVSFCGMCGEPLLTTALVSSTNNGDGDNNPPSSSSSSSSAAVAASSQLHPPTNTITASTPPHSSNTNDDGVSYPVATIIPSALPALTVISSLRPLHNQNSSNCNNGSSNSSHSNNNNHSNNDDRVAAVSTTVYSNARMLISRSDDHPRSASSRNLSVDNDNHTNSSTSNNTDTHINDNGGNNDDGEDGDRSPPCVLAEQWLLCIHCGADNPPPAPGDSLVARCETCRRLLLYNEQEPGLGLAPGPGREIAQGPELEQRSELGSGSESEVRNGGEVGVVAVASLDLGEGAAATATPAVAVLR